MSKLPGENYPLRFGVCGISVAGGFIFPPLFILAALVAWSLFDDLRNPGRPEDHPLYDPKQASSSDQNWKATWLGLCESPAESAFLTSMIDHHQLRPKGGKLTNMNVTVDMQVKIDRYRVDFLAGERHVIEIDGAAYHSGEYEEAKDAYRDAVLTNQGFHVLRIPAKVVFTNPGEALRRVGLYLADLSLPVLVPLPIEPKSPYEEWVEGNVSAAAERNVKHTKKGSPGLSGDPWEMLGQVKRRSEDQDDVPF